MICPSLEDFVTYNGLRPARPTWSAPHWRTLSHTMDFACWATWFAPHRRTLSRTTDFARWAQHDLQQDSAWQKTNDTSRIAPRNDAYRIPKDRMLQAVKESVCHNNNDLNYLNGLKILGGRFSRWWTKQSNDGKLALDDAGSKNNEHTEERDGLWRKAKHTILGSVCSDFFNAFWENKWRES